MLVYIRDLGVVELVACVYVVADVRHGERGVELRREVLHLQEHRLGLLKAPGRAQAFGGGGVEPRRGVEVRTGVRYIRKFHGIFLLKRTRNCIN